MAYKPILTKSGNKLSKNELKRALELLQDGWRPYLVRLSIGVSEADIKRIQRLKEIASGFKQRQQSSQEKREQNPEKTVAREIARRTGTERCLRKKDGRYLSYTWERKVYESPYVMNTVKRDKIAKAMKPGWDMTITLTRFVQPGNPKSKIVRETVDVKILRKYKHLVKTDKGVMSWNTFAVGKMLAESEKARRLADAYVPKTSNNSKDLW